MCYTTYCGIDFGTSNSSIAIAASNSQPCLISVEQNKTAIPSAIFYPENSLPIFGTPAIRAYTSGEDGRFMRSLKRVLGTDLMSSGTTINGKQVKFENILAQYIKNLKAKAQAIHEQDILHVVMGRPVYFRDNDPKGNTKAQAELENVAKMSGFKHITFQFEPIAAAFAHESKLNKECLACVVDIGGGTSDFSIIRVGPALSKKLDRSDDILANTGVRIGGNDFDKDLSISSIMPELGMGTTYGTKNLLVPTTQYFDLSEWSKVNSVYSYQNLKIVSQTLMEAHNPQKYSRLLEVLETQRGHNLLGLVEDTKINLTNEPQTQTILSFLSDRPQITTSQHCFNSSISANVERVGKSLKECLTQAGVNNEDIDLIILTGGSTEIPFVKQSLCSLLPNAQISDENKLSSVGLGLAYDSLRRFA